MNILAINFNHDGAAVLLVDGVVASYVTTERRSRLKKHPGVRSEDLEALLRSAGVTFSQVDIVLLVNLNTMDTTEVSHLHGSVLKETWPDFWIDKTFSVIRLEGHELRCVLAQAHHYYHAALAYYTSPYTSAVSLACDPVGAGAFLFEGQGTLPLRAGRRMISPAVYDMVAAKVFGSGLVGAGKLMALAPFARGCMGAVDYSRWMTLNPEQACQALTAEADANPALVPNGTSSVNAALAYHAQAFLEWELDSVLAELYDTARANGIEPNLCLSGGTALNSVANQRCFERSQFRHLYLHPACGDDGTAIGAALVHWHQYLGKPRREWSMRSLMYSPTEYRSEIAAVLANLPSGKVVTRGPSYIAEAARLLADGKVLGWFRDGGEIGPRALGNRSILLASAA